MRLRGTNQPSGMAIFAVVIFLALVAALIAMMAESLRQRRSVQAQFQRTQQASWLADSALLKAKVALEKDREYKGENWKIPIDQLNGRHEGLVEITVGPVANDSETRQIRAVAKFPSNRAIYSQVTQTTTYTLQPSDGTNENTGD